MSAPSDCLFCRIAAGELPASVVYQDEHTVAFRDTNPQAPVHLLVVPREHHADLAALGGAPEAAAGYLAGIRALVAQEGLEHYRMVFNTGADVGQSVFHVHGHVLAGRPMGWPPG